MSNLIAEIISLIFSPLAILVPVPYFLIYETGGTPLYSLGWTIISLVFISIFALFVILGKEVGFFSDLDVSKRKERYLFFSFGIFLTLLYSVVLYIFNAPKILFLGAIALSLGLIIVEIVNRYIKSSVHIATLSAFFTALMLIEGWIFFLGFALIPVVAWARLKTKRHTPLELTVGFVLGISVTLLIYVGYRYIV